MEYKEGMRVEFKRSRSCFISHHEKRFGVVDRITQYLIYVVGRWGMAVVPISEVSFWLMPPSVQRKRN